MLPAWGRASAISLPHGRSLPEPVWRQRHRFLLGLVGLHVVGLPLFGLYMGEDLVHVLWEGALILCLLALAIVARSRTLQATFASLALVSSSAILVHFSGGYIEAHFHFFVSLAFITLYQEWLPFVLTVALTVIHHGAVGVLDPTAVYNHPAALAAPWKWALIHGLFVFGACVAYVVQWRLNEQARHETEIVLDAAGDAIVGVDLRRNVTFANPAARRLLAADLVGRPLPALLGPVPTSDGGAHAKRETEAPDGTPIEITVSPMRERGTMRGHVLTIVDLSDRRRAEEERLRHRDEQVRRLQELDELKTMFVNTVAHELRTPMTPLRVQAGLLRRVAPPEALKSVEILDRNLGRLSRLVDDVLDVARLQAQRLSVETEDVDLAAAVSEAFSLYRPLAEEAGVHLEASCPKAVTVAADPGRLAQMLHNLIANALRCAPGGRVQVTAATLGEQAIISVHDDGVGLTQEQIDRLFQPFGQVDAGSPEQRQGTGLGLYLTRELARLHGGDVSAASEGPGQGSTFTISLPLAAPAPLLVHPSHAGRP